MSESALRALLGPGVPDELAALPAAVQERLAEQVDAARLTEEQHGREAIDAALSGVPLPVRGLVRKALGG